MAVKLRLQRKGKKGKPFYYIVAAHSTSKRDGKYIERIGSYNPNTDPATIDMDFDRALHWVKVGAQPTDTMRAMLSYKGVMYKNHLDKGVLKGALTQEQADAKFQKWLDEKEGKIQGKRDRLAKASDEAKAKQLAAEKEVNEKRASEIAAANAPVEEEAPEAEAATEEVEASAEGETPEATEEPKAEEAAAEETPAEEASEEEKKED